MKLERVRFASLVKFDNGTSSDEAMAEVHGNIEWDAEDQTITVGKMCFPMTNVRSFVKAPGEPCPECHEQFSGPTATSAHRRFAHGVLGRKAQKAAEKNND